MTQSALSPLRHRTYAAVWVANICSNIGNQVQAVGAAWFMVSISASPQMVALVQTATALPAMLLALVAGALADTYDRRFIMLGAQAWMMIAAIVTAGLAFSGSLTPVILLVLTFAMGIGAAFNLFAWHSSVGEMVPRESLPGAIALNSAGFNVARSVGPAVGGAIVAAGGAALAFAANAISYAGLLLVLSRWRPERPPRLLPREQLLPAIAAGIRYAVMSPAIGAVLLRASGFGFSACALLALLPLIVSESLHGGALLFGLMLGGFGLGAIASTLLGVGFRRRHSHETVVRVSISLLAGATLVMALSPFLALCAVAIVVGGAGWALSLSTFNTTVQVAAPRWVVARSLALYQMANSAGMAVGAYVWGTLAGHYNLQVSLLVASGMLFLTAAAGLVQGLRPGGLNDTDPAGDFRAPPTAVAVKGGSGPVVVFVKYQVPRENIRRFKSLMAQRRRIRLRDGARQWSLLRDLDRDELWVEQYAVPTWTEYLRFKNRRTKVDASIGEAIRALLRPGTRPSVTRTLGRAVAPGRDQLGSAV